MPLSDIRRKGHVESLEEDMLPGKEGIRFKIHYRCWGDRFDEWKMVDTDGACAHIFPKYTKVQNWRTEVEIGDRMEYKLKSSGSKMWYACAVEDIIRSTDGESGDRVHISNKSESNVRDDERIDMEVDLESDQLVPQNVHLGSRNFKFRMKTKSAKIGQQALHRRFECVYCKSKEFSICKK